jgi:putative nucleotide binding protein
MHMLHLLPGIGKKLMWEILEARNHRLFESFFDISARIKSIPHPEKMIIARIMEELQNKDVKYHVFTTK